MFYFRTFAPLALRLLRTFAGVLGEKIRMRAILKENTANYIFLESLINVDFGKDINCRFLQFRKTKSQSTAKMTMCHSIELTVQRPCRPEPALILRVFAFGPSLP